MNPPAPRYAKHLRDTGRCWRWYDGMSFHGFPDFLFVYRDLYHVFVFVYLWFEFLLLMMMCIQIYIYIHIYILLSFASEQIRWYLDMDAAIIIWLSGQWQYLKGKDSVGDTASFHWTIWKGTGYHVRYLTSPSPFVARSSAPYEPLLVCFFLVALCGKKWCVIDMFQLHSYT